MKTKVKAVCSFCGAVCMNAGEERALDTGTLLDSLIAAGYVEPLPEAGEQGAPEKSEPPKKEKKTKPKEE